MSLFAKPVRLSEKDGTLRVSLDARIVSGNVVVAPISGFTGAMVHLTVAAVGAKNLRSEPWTTFLGFRVESDIETVGEIGSAILGDTFDVASLTDGAILRVSTHALRVEPMADLQSAAVLETVAPAVIERLIARAAGLNSVARVRETYFRQGDKVRLSAHVTLRTGVVASGYRSSVESIWETRPDLGQVVLTEIL